MSDTPRTDREKPTSGPYNPQALEAWEFSRSLEREITQLRIEILQLRSEVKDAYAEGWNDRECQLGIKAKYKIWYDDSRAKRVAEGKEQ